MFRSVSIPVLYRIPHKRLVDELLKHNVDTTRQINIFMDTKSVIPHLYNKDIATTVVEMADSRLIVKGLLEIILYYINFFKKYEFENAVNFVLFSETGESVYHKKYSTSYKANRKISKLNMYGSNELKESVQKQMYTEILEAYTYLGRTYPDNILCYNLEYLEADFIPLYIIEKEELSDPYYFNIILSKDKDLSQCLIYDNTIQITKTKDYTFSCPYDAIQIFDKKHTIDISKKDINFGYCIPIILAMMGDAVDGVKGLEGVGFIKAYNFLKKVFDLTTISSYIEPSDIITAIENKNLSKNPMANKIINNIDSLETDFNLVSFKRLIDSRSAVGTKIEPYYNSLLDTSHIDEIERNLNARNKQF